MLLICLTFDHFITATSLSMESKKLNHMTNMFYNKRMLNLIRRLCKRPCPLLSTLVYYCLLVSRSPITNLTLLYLFWIFFAAALISFKTLQRFSHSRFIPCFIYDAHLNLLLISTRPKSRTILSSLFSFGSFKDSYKCPLMSTGSFLKSTNSFKEWEVFLKDLRTILMSCFYRKCKMPKGVIFSFVYYALIIASIFN